MTECFDPLPPSTLLYSVRAIWVYGNLNNNAEAQLTRKNTAELGN